MVDRHLIPLSAGEMRQVLTDYTSVKCESCTSYVHESRYLDRDAPQIKRWRDIYTEYQEIQEMERTKRERDPIELKLYDYARLVNARPV